MCSAAADSFEVLGDAEVLFCRNSIQDWPPASCGLIIGLGHTLLPTMCMPLPLRKESQHGSRALAMPFCEYNCDHCCSCPHCPQDLDALLSAFSAKPWRKGCIPTLSFIFRTKAAFAYPTYSCKTCRAHTCACFKTDMPLQGLGGLNTDGGSQRAMGSSTQCVQGVGKDAEFAGTSNAGSGGGWRVADAGHGGWQDQH